MKLEDGIERGSRETWKERIDPSQMDAEVLNTLPGKTKKSYNEGYQQVTFNSRLFIKTNVKM